MKIKRKVNEITEKDISVNDKPESTRCWHTPSLPLIFFSYTGNRVYFFILFTHSFSLTLTTPSSYRSSHRIASYHFWVSLTEYVHTEKKKKEKNKNDDRIDFYHFTFFFFFSSFHYIFSLCRCELCSISYLFTYVFAVYCKKYPRAHIRFARNKL